MKGWIKRIAGVCTAVLVLTFGVFNMQVWAQTNGIEAALTQVEKLQQLAADYMKETQQDGDTLMLTINYIRANRYQNFTWDMILGTANPTFSEYVQQIAPELQELSKIKHVVIDATQEQVDFVHLIAGIGATYRRMPIICTWGGDCIQLAESIYGTMDTETDCMQRLKPYFAAKNENASLFPQSDWIADLDGVNIGNSLKKNDDLADKIREYYSGITDEKRAAQFIGIQFGESTPKDTQEFRGKVKQTFEKDSGVQLFLMTKEYMMLNEEKNGVIIPEMEQPLNAVCSLMADELLQLTRNVQWDQVESEKEESKDISLNNDIASSASNSQAENQLHPKNAKDAHNILKLIGVLIMAAAILLVVLIRKR